MQQGEVIKTDFGFPQPTADRVIVEPIDNYYHAGDGDVKASKDSAIILPTMVRDGEKPTQGRIMAVGPGTIAVMTGVLIEPRVKVGQIVVFTKYSGDEMEFNGRKYLLVKEESVLCVLK